jgi:hypothetical protein
MRQLGEALKQERKIEHVRLGGPQRRFIQGRQ